MIIINKKIEIIIYFFSFFKSKFVCLSGPERLPDQFKDFFGHRFRVVAMRTLPWMDYEGGGGGWAGGPLTPRDSLNARMLRAMADHSNFT